MQCCFSCDWQNWRENGNCLLQAKKQIKREVINVALQHFTLVTSNQAAVRPSQHGEEWDNSSLGPSPLNSRSQFLHSLFLSALPSLTSSWEDLRPCFLQQPQTKLALLFTAGLPAVNSKSILRSINQSHKATSKAPVLTGQFCTNSFVRYFYRTTWRTKKHWTESKCNHAVQLMWYF